LTKLLNLSVQVHSTVERTRHHFTVVVDDRICICVCMVGLIIGFSVSSRRGVACVRSRANVFDVFVVHAERAVQLQVLGGNARRWYGHALLVVVEIAIAITMTMRGGRIDRYRGRSHHSSCRDDTTVVVVVVVVVVVGVAFVVVVVVVVVVVIIVVGCVVHASH